MLTSPPHSSIIYATRPGGTTLDQDAFGGNAFATALIELSQQQDLELGGLVPALRQLTLEMSANHQAPTWDRLPSRRGWKFSLAVGKRQERRIALVLVVSKYFNLVPPLLTGAANDERRIAAMLASHGFSVLQGVAPDKHSLLNALRSFAIRSKGFEVALIYSTGHGVELQGHVHLLPGNYPFHQGYSATSLRRNAVQVTRIASACKASKLNLTFFAGCRTKINGTDRRQQE